MTPSKAAAVIFGYLSVFLIFVLWIFWYRGLRRDLLRARLEALRDEAYDAGSTRPAVEWIETLAASAGVLTPTHFLLACAMEQPVSGTSLDGPFVERADALIRRHLAWGFWPLAAWFAFRPRIGHAVLRSMATLSEPALPPRWMSS